MERGKGNGVGGQRLRDVEGEWDGKGKGRGRGMRRVGKGRVGKEMSRAVEGSKSEGRRREAGAMWEGEGKTEKR